MIALKQKIPYSKWKDVVYNPFGFSQREVIVYCRVLFQARGLENMV